MPVYLCVPSSSHNTSEDPQPWLARCPSMGGLDDPFKAEGCLTSRPGTISPYHSRGACWQMRIPCSDLWTKYTALHVTIPSLKLMLYVRCLHGSAESRQCDPAACHSKRRLGH